MRDVDHLLIVESRSACVSRGRVHGRGRTVQAQPVGGPAFGVELDAVVRLAALLFETEIARAAGGAKAVRPGNHLRIKERREHVEDIAGQQYALTGFVFCADLCLAREKRSEKLAAVIGPEGRLGAEREHDAVVRVERKALNGIECNRVLRQPYGLVGGLGGAGIRIGHRRWIELGWIAAARIERVVVIAQRVVTAARDELNAGR